MCHVERRKRREQAIQMRREGRHVRFIAEALGLSEGGVRNICRAAGVRVRRRSAITPEVRERMAGMRKDGLNFTAIANRLRCAQATVANNVKEAK